MRRRLLLLAACSLGAATPTAATDSRHCDWTDVDVVGRARAPVVAATLGRPYMEARFGPGMLYGLEACAMRVGLIYLGAGALDVRDPGPERGPQLRRQSADLPGTVGFNAAVLWASDGAVESLLGQASPFEEGPVPPAARAMLAARSDGFRPELARSWRPPGEVLHAPNSAQGGILAEFRTEGVRWMQHGDLEVVSPWLSYVWAPTGPIGDPVEPGVWLRRGTGTTLQLLLSGFPTEDDVAAAGTPFAAASLRRRWDLRSVEIGLAVSGPMGLSRVLDTITGDARLELIRGEGAGRWLLLALDQGMARQHDEQFAALDVLGVSAGADTPEPVPWRRVGDRLWVKVPEGSPGSVAVVRVRWRGRVLEVQGQTGVTALGSSAWYPRPPGRDRHRVTTTVAVPAAWEVIATGHRIGDERNGNVRVVTSRASHPVPYAGVVVADVRTEVIAPGGPGVPLIRLHRSPEYPAINARVGAELAAHMQTLVELLGPYPWSELEVVERGRSAGGRADLPGIVAVGSWDSPPRQVITSGAGDDTALGALARQWIGLEMGAGGYHDAWLIEGLTTWARCLALEAAAEGGRCYGALQAARRRWLDHLGGNAKSDAALGGAIWLDQLSGSAELNRRSRGPLVLHQLRLLVGDAVVRAALPRLLVAYGGQGLTLGSFLVQVQALAGTDLRAFVYGWVFNTPTRPVARLAYRLEDEDGAWTLIATGEIDIGPEEPTPLPTPILLGFKVGEESHVRRLVLTDTPTEVRIEGIPEKPRDIRLDPAGTFPGKVEVTRARE